ncbi:MAG: cupredoxin family copper-binding protein [Nanoarchaeota archaeon]|nr:cupredoxin family copper-binding protein [Nanoarchaeota archaeon]
MAKGIIILAVMVGIFLIVGGYLLVTKSSMPATTSAVKIINPPENPSSSSTPKSYNIDISGFVFSPNILTIKVGDSVEWTNKDSASHTVTSDSRNELNSETLSGGESYSHTFNSAGTFSYHCSAHTSMKAKIIVE